MPEGVSRSVRGSSVEGCRHSPAAFGRGLTLIPDESRGRVLRVWLRPRVPF